MNPLFGIFEGLLSPGHLILLLIIGILFFGKRLPEMGRCSAFSGRHTRRQEDTRQ